MGENYADIWGKNMRKRKSIEKTCMRGTLYVQCAERRPEGLDGDHRRQSQKGNGRLEGWFMNDLWIMLQILDFILNQIEIKSFKWQSGQM
jgi:hypothetical protein